MTDRRRSFRNFGLYALNTSASAGLPLITAPIAIGVSGTGAWETIAVAQGVGSLGGVITGYGWAAFGPALVAQSQRPEAIFARAMIMRLGLALLTLPLSIAGAAYLTSDADVAALAAAGTLLAGLTSPWYFIGLGRAGSVITLDTLPRLAFAGLGLTATVALADIRWFLWSQLVGVIVAVLWTTLRSVRIRDLYRVRWAEIRTAYLEQASAFGVSLTTALYGTAIVPMVAFVDPSLAGAFAILLRLQKFVLALLRPVTQVLQSWVPSGSSEAFQQRAKTGMFLGLGSGLLATTILIFFHAELIGLLSGGTLTEPVWTIAVMAATIPPIMLTQVTGLVVLVSRGLGGTVFKSTLVCAIVCLAAIIPSAWVLGLVGVWISILAGEILVVVWHLRAIRNRWSSWRLTPRLEV